MTREEISTAENLDASQIRNDGPRSSIKRNYAIALVANSLKTAAEASNDENSAKAEKRLIHGIAKAKEVFDHKDKQLHRVIKIADDYRKNLSKTNQVASAEKPKRKRSRTK